MSHSHGCIPQVQIENPFQKSCQVHFTGFMAFEARRRFMVDYVV